MTITLPGSTDDAPSVPGNVTATPTGGGPRRRPDLDGGHRRRHRDAATACTANGVQIAAPAGLSYHDAAGHGRFSYGVSAVDDQNQESAVAGPAPVSVGDTAPPTVPAASPPRSSRAR